MAIFVVISESASEQLFNTIAHTYPGNFYKIGSDQWLIAAHKRTKDVADSLNISVGAVGRAAVFKMDGYFGWHDKRLWEWLELKGYEQAACR